MEEKKLSINAEVLQEMYSCVYAIIDYCETNGDTKRINKEAEKLIEYILDTYRQNNMSAYAIDDYEYRIKEYEEILITHLCEMKNNKCNQDAILNALHKSIMCKERQMKIMLESNK